MRFEGSRVVVTGSSRNTGLGIARRFAAEGARVVVNGSKADNVAAAVSSVPGSVGAVADLSTEAGVEALFEAGNITGARLVVDGGVTVQLVPASVEG